MKTFEATEQAYKNGYEQGKKDALKWIPVSERLPGVSKNVLIHREDGSIDIECQCRSGGWICDLDSKHEVTHWMPLPEAPKGE